MTVTIQELPLPEAPATDDPTVPHDVSGTPAAGDAPVAAPPAVTVDAETITIGAPGLRIAFHRTLRIPDDGNTYPLPPSLGAFPLRRVADYPGRVPAAWLETDGGDGGVFLPLYQREALWLSFSGAAHALKLAIGRVNAVTGGPWSATLDGTEQDYLVCPDQPWLDGINAGDGFIKQFVAMPLGQGYTVEAQLTGEERYGGVQLLAVPPHPGRVPEHTGYGYGNDLLGEADGMLYAESEGLESFAPMAMGSAMVASAAPVEMGLGAGGKMEQAVYPDPYGVDAWDTARAASVHVHFVDPATFAQITGEAAPRSPIDAATYTRYGYPWFALYDEHRGDLPASGALAEVQTLREIDATRGITGAQDDTTVPIPVGQVVDLSPATELASDGAEETGTV